MYKINWDEQPLGKFSDACIGRELGVSTQAIAYQRKKRDIPAFKIKGEDLTNKKYNRLTVVGLDSFRKNSKIYWICKCDCGKVISTQGTNLTNGNTQSCGCLCRERARETNLKDLTGKRFGSLEVVEEWSVQDRHGNIKWLCKCDCGELVVKYASSLKVKRYQSCGCKSLPRKKQEGRSHRFKDLVGERFSRLEVLEEWPIKGKHKNIKWLCKCDCGELTVVYGAALKKGSTRSCGCLRRSK